MLHLTRSSCGRFLGMNRESYPFGSHLTVESSPFSDWVGSDWSTCCMGILTRVWGRGSWASGSVSVSCWGFAMWAALSSAQELEKRRSQGIPEAIWIALSTVCQLERTVAMAERISSSSG